MPQAWLPLIPSGATPINDAMSVVKENGKWFYFCGINPVFFHDEGDRRSFRMFTAQLICQGICRQAQIIRAFGVSKNSVNRSVKKYGEGGPGAFFAPRKGHGGSVLTAEVKDFAQELLNLGKSKQETARELGVKYDTLRKAVNQGRLSEPEDTKKCVASDKSARSVKDAASEMGIACTRSVERVAAALERLPGGASTCFEPCRDVSWGGVLCALPALIAGGLLSHMEECFETLKGYYTNAHILILSAYMALCRIKTAEQLQYQPPGEFGKLLGLDRIPEVRCLRYKLADLSENDAPQKWSRLLSRDWMESAPALAGALYVDGHVRVYHGKITDLPKKFVSRQRLCLRGTTDYWVNDVLGQPYFVVDRPVDQGMLEALKSDIIPRLLNDVPMQPSEEALIGDPCRHRFIMIFDREGYSPSFFKEMWEAHRIACITYHKFPRDLWPEEWFVETEVEMPNGEKLTIRLAEMGSFIGDKKNGLWVREVRKLGKNNHQTSLLSTAKSAVAPRDAALIFSRWSQENFFGYMMKHYAIDLLSEYGTEEFPGKQTVVNPAWRELDRQCHSLKSKLTHRRAQYAALDLHPEMDDKKVAKWRSQKAELVEEIEPIEHELEQLKEQLKNTPKHIDWRDLENEDKFERLKPSRKRLTDTIKMIAYRAETAMVNIVREELAREDDARSLIRDLYQSAADILPDLDAGVLTIQVHHMANPRSNRAIEHLLQNINDADFNYPGTKLRLRYRMASPSRPPSEPEKWVR
jgi:transposase/predicted  nucleic acid-binding Zn-ribbon protein